MRKSIFNTLTTAIIIFSTIICLMSTACAAAPETEEEETLSPIGVQVGQVESREDIAVLLENCQTRKDNAHQMAQCARALGYKEEHIIIQLAKLEWLDADAVQRHYEEVYEQMGDPVWDARAEEYPEATEIWLYMKDLGWSDAVCAGIMGNLMAEVGGQTLNLRCTLYSPGKDFYGICQWNKKYYPEIHGADLKTQCDFLRDTIEEEFKVFGGVYKRGFTFEKFLALTNERDVALAFAKVYERCGTGSYSTRQRNAEKAFNYFVTE